MQSEEQKGDKHEDTGIGLTFASKQDVTELDKETEIPRSTSEEPIASTGTKVSPFPIASFEEPSFNSSEVEILPRQNSNTMVVKLDPGPSRPKEENINVI